MSWIKESQNIEQFNKNIMNKMIKYVSIQLEIKRK